MAIEVNGEPIAMQDFYPDIQPPKNIKHMVFKRIGFEPFKRIVSSLDRGPNSPPLPQWQANITSVDSGGIVIPLEFHAAVELNPEAQNATMRHVRYFTSKTTQGMGATAVTVYTGSELFIRGAGTVIDVTTPNGIAIYKCLMVHPYNKLNAKRYGQRRPLFELEEVDKARKISNEQIKNRNRAIGLAFDETKVPMNLAISIHKEICGFLNTGESTTDEYVLSEQFATIRNDISLYASAYPEKFEKMVSDAGLGLRGLVKHGLEKGVLLNDGQTWSWGVITAVKRKKEITSIQVGEDDVQELLNHFMIQKGKKDLELFEEEMKLYQS